MGHSKVWRSEEDLLQAMERLRGAASEAAENPRGSGVWENERRKGCREGVVSKTRQGK